MSTVSVADSYKVAEDFLKDRIDSDYFFEVVIEEGVNARIPVIVFSELAVISRSHASCVGMHIFRCICDMVLHLGIVNNGQ